MLRLVCHMDKYEVQLQYFAYIKPNKSHLLHHIEKRLKRRMTGQFTIKNKLMVAHDVVLAVVIKVRLVLWGIC